jgi:muramoyltetrapeptide carboxypeptidase
MRPRCYVCCPAYALHGPVDRDRIVHSMKKLAGEVGIELVLSPLLDRHRGHGAWLPEKERVADVERALHHDLVWAARGGYGSVHLIDAVLGAKVDRPPLLIGYSDLTILHACWRVRGWPESLYGSIPTQLERSRGGETLLAGLRGLGFQRSNDSDGSAVVLRAGDAKGTLVAGCLSVLAGLVGTNAMPDLDGCILAVEDVDERPFLVDYTLQQLYRSKALAGVRGLIGGSFSYQEKPDYMGPGMLEILRGWSERLGVPTIARLPFGHLNDGLILPWGRDAELHAHKDGQWRLTVRDRKRRFAWETAGANG